MEIQDINEFSNSVENFTKSSKEFCEIVRTIDSIAFQSNLLALKAFVEEVRILAK